MKLLLATLTCWIATCSQWVHAADKIPATPREFRAAWVATVANIDWPSKKGLSSDEQQKEMWAILDRCVELKLNAIIFQVRPHCDSLYASELEPWSEYLTGKMGQAPQPFYDPLEFAVEEAHQRGLELHAWFNPYRALHPGSAAHIADNHVSKTQPHIVREYGKHQWLDPGEPDAAEHSMAVIMDVVRRYDIDGVHFDDYFYPYPVDDKNKKPVPFPDEPSWQQAQATGNSLNRNDWRRQNVDRLIHRLSDEIHATKPWVKFGISPFGIWRPGNPPQIKGFDAYDKLYADAKKWIQAGWVDYLTPQLYWKIESPGQCYPLLMQWWHEQNSQHRHLWPGQFTSRVANQSKNSWHASEIVNQIKHTRAHPGATGNVHFSMKALMNEERGVAKALREGVYERPALVPPSPWLGGERPVMPSLRKFASAKQQSVLFEMPNESTPWQWVVKTRRGDDWHVEIRPGADNSYPIAARGKPLSVNKLTVSAVSRTGVEGPAASIDLTE